MGTKFIEFENVHFSYQKNSEDFALKNINLSIEKGEHLAIVGRNGAGKSTLGQLMNGILRPSKGIVTIDKTVANAESEIWNIRKKIGMVFQNPDNQIIGTTLYEEVAFGPENLGVDSDLIDDIVKENLRRVGLLEHINSPANCLSGGQKQKLAIASVLAMEPECIIFDEATSMIDAFERKEIMKIVKDINRESNMTIINITHNYQEVIESERVILVSNGQIVKDDKTDDFFMGATEDLIKEVSAPEVIELFHELSLEGIDLPANITDIEKACGILYKKILDVKRKH